MKVLPKGNRGGGENELQPKLEPNFFQTKIIDANLVQNQLRTKRRKKISFKSFNQKHIHSPIFSNRERGRGKERKTDRLIGEREREREAEGKKEREINK